MSEGVRLCKNCGRKFWSDCADICQECFKRECYREAVEVALVRIGQHRLKIELVPSTCWYKNLRNAVGREAWDRIRRKAYREAGYRCSVCGVDRLLFCHEVWSYDDDKHIQKLLGFEAVCQLCHRVGHIGLAGIQLSRVDYNAVIRHFKRVNRCSYEDFLVARDIAFKVWEARSEFEWAQDIEGFESLVR